MAINQVLVFRTAEGKKVQGVTGAKPAHIVPEEERGKTPIGELFVDFGSRSAEETRSLGLEIGDYGTFDRAGIKFYEDSVCVFRLSMTNTTLSACGYSSVTIDFTSRARPFFVRCRDADTYRVLPFIMVFVHRYRPPLLPRKLYRLFIHADYRPSLIIRPEIHPRHLLPVRRKRRILLRRYAPALFLMRFQGCFF
jgi:hypothetical protein